tara:strand:- start:1470 stop:2351 length:882 start_codon:yes stop_codon:yes gene_type:complete
MSDKNIATMDLDEMSLDDLDSLLSESEGKPKPKPETDIKAEPNTEVDKEVDSEVDSSTVEEDSKPETEEEPKGKPEEEDKVDEEDSVEPQYRGKSKDDILEMQRNANRKISQQNNEIYHLKKRMEEISQSQEKRVEEKVKDPLDEIRERYAEEDLNAIEALVNRAMSKKDAAIQEKKEVQKTAIMKEHDEMWENFKLFNPALHEKVGPEAIRLMKADESSTYQRKGWLREFIAESSKKGAAEVKPVQKSVVKKRTPTISGGGGAGSSGKINKSIEEMSPDEFLQHSLSKGIKI